MASEEDLDLIEEYLNWVAESDGGSVYEEIAHEFEVVRTIVENNNAQEWLDGLVEDHLDYAKEWKENDTW